MACVRVLAWAVPILLAMVTEAAADFLPSRPISLWNGRLVVSGELTATFGSRDDAYFNALDYSHDAFNLFTGSAAIEVRAHERLTVLAQVVDEVALRRRNLGATDWHVVRPYALYVRLQPFRGRPVHIQAGRIPPVFGRFARQDYSQGNPLIGLPLAYHYPTVMRGDVAPPTVRQLLAQRGNGWRVSYPTAQVAPDQGVPLISARRWDTGVQGSVAAGRWEAAAAVTSGTLSRPLTEDDNGGKQVSGRVGVRPLTGLVVGASIARGEFVTDAARRALAEDAAARSYRQTAWGVDAEYSAGYVIVRGEVIGSRWATPFSSGEPTRRLGARSGWAEGRVSLTPRWYVAIRGERLGFASLAASADAVDPYTGRSANPGMEPGDALPAVEWDAPVTRFEAGVGYRLHRNARMKVSWQENWRDGGRTRRDTLVGAQLAYWF